MENEEVKKLSDLWLEEEGSFGNQRFRETSMEIVRCYRHSWDVFSELLQNSVDAINRRFRIHNDSEYRPFEELREEFEIHADPNYAGRIRLRINVPEKTIEIADNGIGIRREKMQTFLLPGQSGKKSGQDYGFKGYGLTFASFISREFIMKSRFALESSNSSIQINDIFNWLVDQSGEEEFPDTNIDYSPDLIRAYDGSEANTSVRIKLESDYSTRCPVIAAIDSTFETLKSDENWDTFEYMLRSRTAIGNTNVLFGKRPIVPIDIKVKIVFPGGYELEKEIEYKYYHPKDFGEVGTLLFEFDEYTKKLLMSGFDKKFNGLFHTKENVIVGTQYPVVCDFALLAVSSTRLSRIEAQLDLDKISDLDISYGVFLAIDGMPTGIQLDDWDRRGGERKKYHVIINANLDISNQLDSGRKGISNHYGLLISEKAWELISSERIAESDTFRSYTRNMSHGRRVNGTLTSNDFHDQIRVAKEEGEEKEELEADVTRRIRARSKQIYVPREEQEVISLFINLLSRNHIKGYEIQYLSSSAVYDAAFLYSLELINDNLVPDDPIGFSPNVAHEFKQAGYECYIHEDSYPGKTLLPQLCVEFKINLGEFLREMSLPTQTSKEPRLIDLLIAWDETCPEIYNDYTLSEMHDSQRIFHGTTNVLGLTSPEHTEIDCIFLKQVLEKIG